MGCPGPLVWFNANSLDPSKGAVLECAQSDCDYIVVTGTPFDEKHSQTETMREGLA